MSSDTGVNRGSSNTIDRHGNVLQPQEHTLDHSQVLSVVSNIYPHLDGLEISSHDRSRVPVSGSRIDAPGNVSAFNSVGQHQGRGYMHPSPSTPTSSPVQHEIGPSVISHQVLPTYRQVTMTAGGSHPSGNPSTGSESIPYHLESSLPDILHSHMVPRIPPARPNQHRQHRSRNRQNGEEGTTAGNRHRQRTHSDRSGRHRIPSARTQSSSSSQTQENSCKEPCVKCVVTVTSFRWVLVVLSVLGVSCVTAGIVLAALHPAVGTSLLYLSVMFIGLGVLLVIVVAVGWKCTPRGHEPLHALFGIGNFRHRRTREGRHGRYRHRDRNWFGGMLYPEFQYRRPPPSYAASMQDYQTQVSQEQDESCARNTGQGDGDSLPSSPPPSYRSRASTAHSGIHIAFPHSHDGEHPNSRPPTYRSRAPSRRPSIPHEVESEQTVLESEHEDGVLRDISFVGSSHVHISSDGAQTSRVIVSSASPSYSHIPASEPTEKEMPSDKFTSSKQGTSMPAVSQVYTVPLRRTSQSDVQTRDAPLSAQNFNSDVSLSASSQINQQNLTSESQSAQRQPSLHQRMASEDRHVLEQTLQSLEEHMNESTGIMNEGANFDEQEQKTNSSSSCAVPISLGGHVSLSHSITRAVDQLSVLVSTMSHGQAIKRSKNAFMFLPEHVGIMGRKRAEQVAGST